MSWTEPPLPLPGMVVALLCSLLGLATLLSVLTARLGLPKGWSVQRVARKPGALRTHTPVVLGNLALMLALSTPAFVLLEPLFPFAYPGLAGLGAFALIVLFDDLGFYLTHRLMHENKWVYRRIHRLHHRAFAPLPYDFLYVHPAEWMLGATIPVAAIALIILTTGELNAWVLLGWVAFRVLHELDVHSGTRALIGDHIPLFAPVRHHDLHHAKPTLGNYATMFTLWDKVFGTEIPREDSPKTAPPKSQASSD